MNLNEINLNESLKDSITEDVGPLMSLNKRSVYKCTVLIIEHSLEIDVDGDYTV